MRSQARRAGGERSGGAGRGVRRRALLLGLVDPGVRGLCGKRDDRADHAVVDQPEADRARHRRRCSAPAAATTGRACSRANGWRRTMPARRSPSSTTGRPTAAALRDETEKVHDGQRPRACVARAPTRRKQRDFSALIAKLKAAQIDAVYVGGYHNDIAAAGRQARAQGFIGRFRRRGRTEHRRVLVDLPAPRAMACATTDASSQVNLGERKVGGREVPRRRL